MHTKEQVFSLAELSGIAARHMGVNLMSWEMIGNSQMRVKGIVPEPVKAPASPSPPYVNEFEGRVTRYALVQKVGYDLAREVCLHSDWCEALRQYGEYIANQPNYVREFDRRVSAYMRSYAGTRERANEVCLRTDWDNALIEQRSRNLAVDREPSTITLHPCQGMPFQLDKASLVVPKTYTPIDDSAERHRAKRVAHAERVCAKHSAFDWEAVPVAEGERLDTRARLERLEAAVMCMASHDPTGPIVSARDFLSLRVSKPLAKVLRTVVYK